jgi:two-component system chemotaxis sensor kinase CheA
MTGRSADRFRDLFAQEAEVRLARLSQLLLNLDRSGADTHTVDEIFREVHTLKGSAAVVGFDAVSSYAHGLEERLDDVRAGRASLTPDLVDALLVGVDELGRLSAASLASGGDVDHVESAQPAGDIPAGVSSATVSVTTSQPTEAPRQPGSSQPASSQPASSQPASSRGSILVPVERLEELVRSVGEAASAHLRVGRMVQERLGVAPSRFSELTDLSRLLNELQDKAMRTQMVPVATVTDRLHRAVRDLSRTLGKDVRWEVEGEQTELERNVLHQLADSLLHVVRNAVDHGIEGPEERLAAGKPSYGTVRLHAAQLGSEVIISVADDGRGIDVDAVRAKAAASGIDTEGLTDAETLQLVFHTGVSTAQLLSQVSGRGVGLDVVQASVDAARGRVEITSEHGAGTVMRLVVPITLTVLPCLLADAGGQRFALPLHRVVVVQPGDVATFHGEGRVVLWLDGEPIPVASLAELLGLADKGGASGPIIVVRGAVHSHAFQVDAIVGHRDAVVKGLSAVLPRIDVVAGTSVEPDGSVLVVLDPPGLVDRARHAAGRRRPGPHAAGEPADVRGHVLVVDDALTVRELERSILERAGYEVTVASDGLEALERLGTESIDVVLTDVQMPRMDGFALTRAIRARAELANVPVLIITTLDSADHRQEGLDAGADAYIVKSSFDERTLLEAVTRALGGPT